VDPMGSAKVALTDPSRLSTPPRTAVIRLRTVGSESVAKGSARALTDLGDFEALRLIVGVPSWVTALSTTRGLKHRLKFCLQFPPHLCNALIAELSKKRRWKVILKDRFPRPVFVKHDRYPRESKGRRSHFGDSSSDQINSRFVRRARSIHLAVGFGVR